MQPHFRRDKSTVAQDSKRSKRGYEKTDAQRASVLEAPPGLEPGNRGFAVRCLTTWLWRHIKLAGFNPQDFWSGQRGSNSLPPPWQGGALPDELCPHKTPLKKGWCLRSELNQRHADFQSAALPTELQRHMNVWWEQLDSNQ